MKQKKVFIAFLTISLLFFFLRLVHLEASYNAGSDQGTEILETYKIYETQKITLIGPTSSFVTNGRSFFFGPATYYLSMPALIISNWNPLSAAYFIILIQYAAISTVFFIIWQRTRKVFLTFVFAILYALSPTLIRYSQFLWNPNYTIPTSTFLLACHLLLSRQKKQILTMFLIGFLWGLGLEFHLDFALAIILSLYLIYRQKGFKIKETCALIFGFVAGYFPLIIFEIRHSFYNTKTLLLFLESILSGHNNRNFDLPNYYFFPLIPFFIWAITIILSKIKKINRLAPLALISIFAVYSLYSIIPTPKHGFLMVDGWNYQGVKKTEKIILDNKKNKYNIVDILTGDTRAMFLRAVLTTGKNPPLGTESYPTSNAIFIVTKLPIEQIANSNLWEISVLRPFMITGDWNVQNDIHLYLFERSKT